MATPTPKTTTTDIEKMQRRNLKSKSIQLSTIDKEEEDTMMNFSESKPPYDNDPRHGGTTEEEEIRDGDEEMNDETIVVVPHQQTDAPFGFLMAFISFLFAYLALSPLSSSSSYWPISLLLLWSAMNFFILGWSYCYKGTLGTTLLGKNSNTGQIHWINYMIFLPWHMIYFITWRIKHLIMNEHVYDNIGHGLYVGRLPLNYPKNFPLGK